MKNKKARFLIDVLILLSVLIVTVEIISLSILSYQDYLKSNGDFEAILEARTEDINISKRAASVDYGDFDPIVQMWPIANEYVSHLSQVKANKHGFYSNDSPHLLSEQFPDKDSDIYRIIVVGGSSVGGLIWIKGSETVPAFLEKILNKNHPLRNKYKYIQVLNFSISGGYSGNILSRISNYLLYLNPDAIVYLGGFNDAIYDPDTDPLQIPYYNWGHRSLGVVKTHSKSIDNSHKIKRLGILPFTTSLLDRIYTNIKREENKEKHSNFIKSLQKKMPVPSIVKKVINISDGRSVYFNNLLMIKAILSKFNVKFYSFLQPNDFYIRYTNKENLSLLTNQSALRGVVKNYPVYIEEYKYLAKYESNNNAFFYDLSMSLDAKDDKLFHDGFHFTSKGSEMMSNIISSYIK